MGFKWIVVHLVLVQLVTLVPAATEQDGKQLTLFQKLKWKLDTVACFSWSYYPQFILSNRLLKPGIEWLLEGVTTPIGAPPQCVKLLVKVQYKPLNKNLLQPLRESKLPIIWILGPPGSGKGTLSAKYAESASYTHISIGELIRAEADAAPKPIFKTAMQNYMASGQLFPVTFSLTLLEKKMLTVYDSTKGFLIDGFPRDVRQAKTFVNTIRSPDAIIFLEVSDENILKDRINNRNQGRIDDNDKSFAQRMVVYNKLTNPIKTNPMFKEKVKVVNVDGSVDENMKAFTDALSSVIVA